MLDKLRSAGAALFLAATISVAGSPPPLSAAPGSLAMPAAPAAAPKTIKLDLDKATPVKLPSFSKDLQPHRFKTPDGKEGWALRITGGHTIATPAVWNGMVFVGGGYGSYDFYAFNAATGALIWKIHTNDDGPSAAVVEDGLLAFNTESCTVYVVEARTGKILWQEWLGDPLMSQPAIYKGRLYICHPAGNRSQSPFAGPMPVTALQAAQQVIGNAVVGASRATHRLLCADLRTGKHIWSKPVSGDAISAPVAAGDKVYVTCLDGTSYCFSATSGQELWKKADGGTSAPLVSGTRLITTTRSMQGSHAFEGVRRMDSVAGSLLDAAPIASARAAYLQGGTNGTIGPSSAQLSQMDYGVGFAAPPPAAQIDKALKHLGIATVAGAWGYQGSRVALAGSNAINAQGARLFSVDAKNGRMNWNAEAKSKKIQSADAQQVFSPPALGAKNMYLVSGHGHVIALSQKDGSVRFMYDVARPLSFQPALYKGQMLMGSADGLLMSISTGDQDADGWSAWGGNAQHNKHD